MLKQLLETKPVTQRARIGTCVSVMLHALVIVSAIQLTQRAVTVYAQPEPVLLRMPVPESGPTPIVKRPADDISRSATARGPQVIRRVVDIPIDIPPVDVSAVSTNLPDWSGAGVSAGTSTGTTDPPGATTTAPDAAFAANSVEKVAAALAGSPAPAYPDILKSSGIEGEALVQFVVDTSGRAELGTFTVLQASHHAFGQAVRSALPRMRFLPAELGGRKVRMLVQQTFAFALAR
jgi:periplasmic protein TonB